MTVTVHSSAIVESSEIGDGSAIWAFVHVMPGAVIGEQCKIGDHSFIEGGAVIGNRVTIKNNALIWHGVMIGDDSFIGPNVVFTNDLNPRAHVPSGPEDWVDTVVESGVSIGANSTVVCGITIGHDALIGAGTVVTQNVDSHALVVGNPGRIVGWVCRCGRKLPVNLICSNCQRKYDKQNNGLGEVAHD